MFLTYRASAALDEFVARKTAGASSVDFTGKDGVRHTAWTSAGGKRHCEHARPPRGVKLSATTRGALEARVP